ncbi:2390_t:CDS:2, partial [Cetraspora pellucida]
YQLWTKSKTSKNDKKILQCLFSMGFLTIILAHIPNTSCKFWSCFKCSLDDKKTCNGKRRVLSIIANDFTYEEMQENLKVRTHTISESRKHAILNGCGASPLEKPVIHRMRFTLEQIDQFDQFFTRKDIVKEYPNGMCRTSFMTCLQGSRFVYQDNLGGLCSECNEYGYGVFAEVETLLITHIKEEKIQARSIERGKIGMLSGIKNLQEWTWPEDRDNVEFICARELPEPSNLWTQPVLQSKVQDIQIEDNCVRWQDQIFTNPISSSEPNELEQ